VTVIGGAGQPVPGIGLLGTVGLSPPELVKLAREFEQAGFSGVWVIEYEYDAVGLAQALASGTSRLLTGTAITRAFSRHPIGLANAAALVDRLAPGRFVIGLGTGAYESLDPRMSFQRWGQEWDRPAARMREYVQVVRRALEGELLGFDGDFYRLDHVQIDILPESRVPIFVAGGGARMLEVAGAEADGVFVHLYDRERTERTRDAVAAAALKAGRDPGDIQLARLIMSCVDDDRRRAVEAMRRYLVEWYLTMPQYQRIVAACGYGEVAEAIRECAARGDLDGAVATVPDELIEALTITGTPVEARQKLAEMVGWGTTVPILYPFPARGDWREAYRASIATFAQPSTNV
jgi:alkanesulfonate monooxygenase SsuD/methylene tetrahydromethanopterin reductase-like flavin-dependent oxidoreductase (luciferase family)